MLFQNACYRSGSLSVQNILLFCFLRQNQIMSNFSMDVADQTDEMEGNIMDLL